MLPPGSLDPDDGPSDVIFPPQHITLRFNHAKHLAKDDRRSPARPATPAAYKQRLGAGRRSCRRASTCDACHSTDHDDLAHVKPGDDAIGPVRLLPPRLQGRRRQPVAALAMPRANLVFDHKTHVDRNIGCPQCHGAVEQLELATRDQLPRMRGCFDCHQMPDSASRGDGQERLRHVPLPRRRDGRPTRIKTMFATGTLEPPRWLHNAEHTPDFIERHKPVAADDSQFCANCHTEDFCTDCHDGRVRPRSIHPTTT